MKSTVTKDPIKRGLRQYELKYNSWYVSVDSCCIASVDIIEECEMNNKEKICIENVFKWKIAFHKKHLRSMRYLCIPDYFDEVFLLIEETVAFVGTKSFAHDLILFLTLFCVYFITLLASPIVYLYYWKELFNERQQKVETIKSIKSDYVEFKNETVTSSANMGLYELWCLYVPGSYKFCDSETLPLLKTWIDILYKNNTIGIDELRKCARAIRVRRAKLITALIDSQTCVMFDQLLQL